VPEEVMTALAAGRKPPVKVTINGHTYRSTVASMGGRFFVPLNATKPPVRGREGR